MSSPGGRHSCMGYLPFVAASAALLLACAASEPAESSDEIRRYECAMGIGFEAMISGSQATVKTKSSIYVLERRRSSIGERFASGDVALAQDEERAVLIGADEGPYRDCRERDRGSH
jgi:hypothetical protein